MPVEVVNTIKENEGWKADKMDYKSEEENGTDDLKCLDWLVSYKLPEHFAILDDSFHQFTEKNLFHNSSDTSVSEDIVYYDDKDQIREQVICSEQMVCNTLTGTTNSKKKRLSKKCSLLCWIYRVLATSSERQLSLNDIYNHFLLLNPDWEKLSPNWKFSVGEILLTSKYFIYKHSSWSINTDFALKYEHAALAQGFSHRCPPPISSTCEIIDTSKKSVSEFQIFMELLDLNKSLTFSDISELLKRIFCGIL